MYQPGEGCWWWEKLYEYVGQRICGLSLYLPFNFSVNPKLLLKNSLHRKNEGMHTFLHLYPIWLSLMELVLLRTFFTLNSSDYFSLGLAHDNGLSTFALISCKLKIESSHNSIRKYTFQDNSHNFKVCN